MTDYKAIFGKKIKFLTSDLSAAEAEGEIFYSNTDAKFKVAISAAAWSAGSPYIISADHTAGTGTQTAALSASDGIPSPAGEITSTYEYNGSGWASGGSMNTGRGDGYMNMAGTQTAAFYVGGRPNGSSFWFR